MLSNLDYWNLEWSKIFDHYQNDKRFSYYINAFLEDDEKKILEIAAGSFRDMAILNSLGFLCYGIDFSQESVNKAKSTYHSYKDLIYQADAFNLPFEDKFFDVTYHNGFWGCFSDEDIFKLANEKVRVTKKRIMIGVHNAHNKSFVEYFNKLKKDDVLYSVRFFTISEISDIMLKVCTDLKIIPVGKGKKYYEDYLINLGITSRKELRRCFEFHKMELLEKSERLLCIGTVK